MYDTLHSFFLPEQHFLYISSCVWVATQELTSKDAFPGQGTLRTLLRRREILKNGISSSPSQHGAERSLHYFKLIKKNKTKQKKSFDTASPPELGTSSESWFQNPLACCFRLCFQSSLSSSFEVTLSSSRPVVCCSSPNCPLLLMLLHAMLLFLSTS